MDAQRVPAVRLDDVAVNGDLALAERLAVDDRAQRTADQTLDLARAAVQLERLDVALFARIGRARQHRVLRRDPTEALALEEGRNLFLD